jgi:hypothetical protein
LAELVEIVVKFADLDVHNVVVNEHEFFLGLVELVEDIHNGAGHGLTLGVTNFNLSELVKLLDGTGKVHDVLASLREGVEADEQSVGGDFPLVLALSLVIEVGFLEFSANIDALFEASVSFVRGFTLDGRFYSFSIDVVVALNDDSIADLTDEDHESRGGVVELGVSPDHEDGVHDGDEQVSNVGEFLRFVDQVLEEPLESLQVLAVLVGFLTGYMDLLLQFGEDGRVGGLVLL